MRIELIRHGQTDWNRDGRLQGSSDIPLNDTGRAQAVETAAVLADQGLSAIVSSPLMRARETARIIAEILDIDLGASYDDLIERDYASLEGAVPTEPIPDEPNADFADIEPREAVTARGMRAIVEIRDTRLPLDGPDATVAAVCHGTIIRFVLSEILGEEIPHIHNAAINEIEWADGAWRVLSVNGSPIVEARA
ncbi:histidine phosphatase family protein [Agreia pratensis]|uniref:histidine phosphatase family protein n=1 Tax=Agreia pratensis TaxID=150121 RepID=UPI00188B43A5|nr:histidine phosphatase family protein [Agreia pratensis]MBF4633062.1 histidine phosphatase family protein [Agreia pratensis]